MDDENIKRNFSRTVSEVFNFHGNTLTISISPSANDRGKGIQRVEELTVTCALAEYHV